MRKPIIISILFSAVIIGAAAGVYEWQNQKVTVLMKQQASLKQSVQSLQNQYAAAQSAAKVSISNWKKYCDPFRPFCFSYPNGWKVTDGSFDIAGDKRAYATLVNPDKTLQVDYINPLIKDGGSLSARIVKADRITVDNTKLAVLGIIPVSSGVYQPSYITLSTDQALSDTPGNDALLLDGSINPRFTIGQYDAILLSGHPTTKITSYAQAQAWFDSIDGKTVLKIIESYTGK